MLIKHLTRYIIATLLVLPIWAYGNESLEAPIVEENQNEEVKTSTSTTLTKVLADIARCESGNRQYDSEGNVLRGRVNSQDVGLFQINEKYHLADSKRLGYDIYTEEGNKAYALYLYKTQGVKPWIHSAPCHGFY